MSESDYDIFLRLVNNFLKTFESGTGKKIIRYNFKRYVVATQLHIVFFAPDFLPVKNFTFFSSWYYFYFSSKNKELVLFDKNAFETYSTSKKFDLPVCQFLRK